MIGRAGVIALVGLVLTTVPAAAIRDVAIASEAGGFQPRIASASLGEAVVWQNDDDIAHTSTGRRSLSLWNRYIAAGASRAVNFQQAGTFPYLCTIHPAMTGKVRVPMSASTASVGAGDPVVLRVATPSAPSSGFRYQIGRRRAAGTWRIWRTIDTKTTSWSPKTSSVGDWEFRVRTVRISNGGRSSWSPAIDVEVVA